jgi:hypothetical protein
LETLPTQASANRSKLGSSQVAKSSSSSSSIMAITMVTVLVIVTISVASIIAALNRKSSSGKGTQFAGLTDGQEKGRGGDDDEDVPELVHDNCADCGELYYLLNGRDATGVKEKKHDSEMQLQNYKIRVILTLLRQQIKYYVLLQFVPVLSMQICRTVDVHSMVVPQTLQITTGGPKTKVWCDEEGWTVFQSRGQFGNSKYLFYRNWTQYEHAFGKAGEELMIVDKLNKCTTTEINTTLQITLI